MYPTISIPSYIQGNLLVKQELSNWLKNRDAIAFVGAGASVDLYGTWITLIHSLANKAVGEDRASADERDFWINNASNRPHQVVKAIKNKFGESRMFEAILKDYFSPKIHSSTNESFTPLHEKIAKLPLKGVVTTNYDCGLWHAMRKHKPSSILNYATWSDTEIINSWYNHDIFGENACPLLYAHGFYEKSSTIILDADKYREAYKFEPFIEMYKNLWATQHLLIIGVGFTDSWMDRTLDNILTHLVQGVGTRHIAIMGLRDDDEKHAASIRLMMQSAYNAKVYFYKIKKKAIDPHEDHSELLEFLEELYNNWLLAKK